MTNSEKSLYCWTVISVKLFLSIYNDRFMTNKIGKYLLLQTWPCLFTSVKPKGLFTLTLENSVWMFGAMMTLLNRNNRSLWGYSHLARTFTKRKSEDFFSSCVKHFSSHEIWKQIDIWLWWNIFCICFAWSSWYFYYNKGCLWQMISSVALLNIQRVHIYQL